MIQNILSSISYPNHDNMKHDMMEILCCPVCKSDLELKAMKEQDGDVIEGILACKKCSHDYKIENSIPNLLPP